MTMKKNKTIAVNIVLDRDEKSIFVDMFDGDTGSGYAITRNLYNPNWRKDIVHAVGAEIGAWIDIMMEMY